MSDFVRRFREAARAEANATPQPTEERRWTRDAMIRGLDRYAVGLATDAAAKQPQRWMGRDVAALLVGFDVLPADVTDAVERLIHATDVEAEWTAEWGREGSVAIRYALLERIAGGRLRPHTNGNGGNGHPDEDL